MASEVDIQYLKVRYLTTEDAGGLDADIGVLGWVPSIVAETDPLEEIGPPGTLAAAGDEYVVQFRLDTLSPGFIFLPSNFHVTMQCTHGSDLDFDALFEDQVCFSASRVSAAGTNAFQLYRTTTMTTAMAYYNGSGERRVRSIQPSPVGIPGRAYDGSNSLLGSICATVKTFNATAMGRTYIMSDCRWYGFPVSAVRNAGLYAPQLGFSPN